MLDDSTKSLYVVLKIAEVCNLACKYCYFFYAGDNTYLDHPQYISAETVEAAANFLAEGARDFGIDEVIISLHGGEPLMVGPRRFDNICRTLRSRLEPQVRLKIDTQTNGTLVDEKWIDIFRLHRVGVGVSLDGPASINDSQRIDRKGRGSHTMAVRGFEKLREAADADGIPEPSIICVLGEDAQPDILFEYFFDVLAAKSVFFKPLNIDHETATEESIRRTETILVRLLHLWLNRNDPTLKIHWFRQIMADMLSRDNPAMRARREIPSFSIRTDGGLCPDDSLAPKLSAYNSTGFSVRSNRLQEFFQAGFWSDVTDAYRLPRGDCLSCRWAAVCRGGFAEHRFSELHGFARKTVYCNMHTRVCADIFDYLAMALPASVIERRLSDIRTHLRVGQDNTVGVG